MTGAEDGIAAPEAVLRFWFEETPERLWFAKDDAFDEAIRERFAPTHAAAAAGDLDAWEAEARTALALVLVLDQFPRNMFRGDPRAFATDAAGLAVAKRAVARSFDVHVPRRMRPFFYLPYEHSEDIADQEACVALVAERLPADGVYLRFAESHRDIVARFGRFPHRNALLGRAGTPEEERFLREEHSGF